MCTWLGAGEPGFPSHRVSSLSPPTAEGRHPRNCNFCTGRHLVPGPRRVRGQVTWLMHCGAVSPGCGARPGVRVPCPKTLALLPPFWCQGTAAALCGGRKGRLGMARGARKWKSRRLPAHPGAVGGDDHPPRPCGPRLQAIGTCSMVLLDFICKNTNSNIK